MAEQRTFNPEVQGSSPWGRTMAKNGAKRGVEKSRVRILDAQEQRFWDLQRTIAILQADIANLQRNKSAQWPHCESRILHAPGECAYCDERPELQMIRETWGICYTGHAPTSQTPIPCPADLAVSKGERADFNKWYGNVPKSTVSDIDT